MERQSLSGRIVLENIDSDIAEQEQRREALDDEEYRRNDIIFDHAVNVSHLYPSLSPSIPGNITFVPPLSLQYPMLTHDVSSRFTALVGPCTA